MTPRRASQSARAGRGPAPRVVGARLVAVLFLLASLTLPNVVSAAPALPSGHVVARNDVPDWLSAETAERLNVGFDVLVPSFVPAPFDGEPTVDAWDGYYSLYWLIPGAPPTYLLITGEVGGTIPDFSYYDRNVQLEINANVQGYDAYHDLTPIYDKVYWQVGNIVYTVDSHNLASTDSLSLATSLFPLGGTPPPADTGGDTGDSSGGDGSGDTGGDGSGDQGGEDQGSNAALGVPETVQSGEVISVTVGGVTDATLSADGGTFSASGDATLGGVGDGSFDWTAPETETDQTVTFTLADGGSGETLATAETVVQGVEPTSVPVQASISCPTLATAGRVAPITVSGSGTVTIDSSDGSFPAEAPNTDFAPDAAGNDELTGTLSGDVAVSWLAPEIAMMAYFFVYDSAGDTLAECGTEVTYDEVAVTPTATPKPEYTGEPGDGTKIHENLAALVAQVLAYRNPAGDATGEPKGTETPSEETAEPTATPTAAPPTPTPGTPIPTVEPSPTLAPATGENGMVASVIGPEGGELHCTQGSGAKLLIPPAALKEPASVIIQPVLDRRLPTVAGIELVAGTGFDVTIAQLNGQSVERLDAPATFTITVSEDAIKPNLTLYRVSGNHLEPLSGVQIDGTTVSVPLNQFSRVVAGIPSASAQASTTRDPMPFILAALAFVVALLAVFAFGSILLRRRPRIVTPRRTAMKRGARIR